MKATLLHTALKGKTPEIQQQILRESLQHIILQEMDRMLFFESICFIGGTALRILYDLKRFSEDLDFSVRLGVSKKVDYPRLLKTLQKKLTALGLSSKELNLTTKTPVLSVFLTFPGLLYELNPKVFRQGQVVSIKLEIDTNPPAGAHEALSAVSSSYLYSIRHYDLPSLFAGKLHAILYRGYTKGRDLYDFFWYTSRGVKVNSKLLQNAMEQSEAKKIRLSEKDLYQRLMKRSQELDFKQAKKELLKFLEDPREADLMKPELFAAQVKKIYFEELDLKQEIDLTQFKKEAQQAEKGDVISEKKVFNHLRKRNQKFQKNN